MKHRLWMAGMAALAGGLTLTAQSALGQTGYGSQSSQSSSSKSRKESASQTSSSTSESSKLSSADRRFVMDAARGGMFEVELGRAIASKTTNDDVKQFAQRMVDDHTKSNDQLKQIASQKGITLPTSLDAKDQRELDRITKTSGTDLDKAYMEHMVRDHHKDIAEFRRASERSSDPEVKNFASSTLPTLEQHLQIAHDTGTKVGANVGPAPSETNTAERKKKTGTETEKEKKTETKENK